MTINDPGDKIKTALAYAGLGLRVFPVHGMVSGHCSCGHKPCRNDGKPGKHPATAHGFKGATLDEATIKQWWGDSPWLNIAIATGRGSGVWVLETDPRHGGDIALQAWEAEHGALPATATVQSGGGGRHYYFKTTPGVAIKSLARVGDEDGVDSRGEGGYIIAPPSLHESGQHYTWLTPLEHGLAEAPDWLLPMVSGGVSLARAHSGTVFTMGSGFDDLASHPGEREGSRNETLCRLLGIHISRGDSPATVEALALAWASRCDPPLSEGKTRHTLKWAEGKRDRIEGDGDEHSITRESVGDNGRNGDNGENGSGEGEVATSCHSYHYCHSHQSEIDCGENSESPSESEGLSPTPPFPVKHQHEPEPDGLTLHPDAYHGLAGEIVRAGSTED